METFLSTLRKNAYDKLDVSSYTIDALGWMCETFEYIFLTFLDGRNIETDTINIIEVGSWKGLSAITMAQLLQKIGFKGQIIAVDTWLGSPEFWTSGLNDSRMGLSLKLTESHGYPQVFYTFTKNVKKYKLDDVIIPFPISSVQGADVLKHYNAQADIIYIDAAHEYWPVLMDIEAYWPLLKDGGFMFGDDYADWWPGVKIALYQFVEKNNLDLQIKGELWWIQKQANALLKLPMK